MAKRNLNLNLHVGKMCPPILTSCSHPFFQPLQCSLPHRCGSKSAINRSTHLYWWAIVLHRLGAIAVAVAAVARQYSPWSHCSHLQWTFSHNAHGWVRHPKRLNKFRIAVEMRWRPDTWFSLWRFCAFWQKLDCPNRDTVETHTSANYEGKTVISRRDET